MSCARPSSDRDIGPRRVILCGIRLGAPEKIGYFLAERGIVDRQLVKDGYRIKVATRSPSLANSIRVSGNIGQVESVRVNIFNEQSIDTSLIALSRVCMIFSFLCDISNNT